MIIRRIQVHNFRKLVEPIVIDGLDKGLTVIAGDNEEGKSTLAECIRTAFFVKHNITGEFAAAMQPYNSSVRPEICIEFELDGEHYRLFKAYCQRPEAELVTPTGTFTGSAAEEELARLLRFSLPKRIRKDEQREHEGVFGMFWVEQGKSLYLEPNEAGRSSIAEALQKEVGDVLGGKRGARLIREVRSRREQLLTFTGKPKGIYATATQATTKIEQALGKVEEELANHARTAEELERCRSWLDRYQREGELETARERLRSAQHTSEKVAGLQSAAHDADITRNAAQARHVAASERTAQRVRLVSDLAAADAALKQLKDLIDIERGRVSAARRKLEANEKSLAEAQEQAKAVEKELKRAGAANRLQGERVHLARLQGDHSAAVTAAQEREAKLAEAAAIKVDKSELRRLRRLHEEVSSARAKLEAAATQVELSIVPGAEVTLDEQPVAGHQRRTLTRGTVIEAPGCLRLSIIPGSGVGNPETELESATREFESALQSFAVASLAEAEEQTDRRAAALNRAEQSLRLLDVHAPQGLEKLSAEIAALASDVQDLEVIVGAGPADDIRDLAGRLPALQPHYQQATDTVEGVRRQVDAARCELNEAINAETAADAKHEHQQLLCAKYRERLESERSSASDQELDAQVLQTMQELKAAEIAVAAAARTLGEADPDAVDQELRMATAALQHIEDDIKGLHERAIRLESELRVSGGLGLGERRDELKARLDAARLEVARIERQATTLDLLLRVLQEAEIAAKEQFLRPVTERVQSYLKILLPGAALAFNEDINIVGLRRGATEEPFESLSVGTREQLAVLTRLAFAELLREHGHPATVLLDDAIVFADEDRFERMLRILDRAAEKLQIIVLSCRERDYRALGAPIIRLADCGVPTATIN